MRKVKDCERCCNSNREILFPENAQRVVLSERMSHLVASDITMHRMLGTGTR